MTKKKLTPSDDENNKTMLLIDLHTLTSTEKALEAASSKMVATETTVESFMLVVCDDQKLNEQ